MSGLRLWKWPDVNFETARRVRLVGKPPAVRGDHAVPVAERRLHQWCDASCVTEGHLHDVLARTLVPFGEDQPAPIAQHVARTLHVGTVTDSFDRAGAIRCLGVDIRRTVSRRREKQSAPVRTPGRKIVERRVESDLSQRGSTQLEQPDVQFLVAGECGNARVVW